MDHIPLYFIMTMTSSQYSILLYHYSLKLDESSVERSCSLPPLFRRGVTRHPRCKSEGQGDGAEVRPQGACRGREELGRTPLAFSCACLCVWCAVVTWCVGASCIFSGCRLSPCGARVWSGERAYVVREVCPVSPEEPAAPPARAEQPSILS